MIDARTDIFDRLRDDVGHGLEWGERHDILELATLFGVQTSIAYELHSPRTNIFERVRDDVGHGLEADERSDVLDLCQRASNYARSAFSSPSAPNAELATFLKSAGVFRLTSPGWS